MIDISDKKIAFFQGAGRSGLELLTSLLDDNKEVLCFPFTLKFSYIWKKYNLNLEKDKENILNTFLTNSKINRFSPNNYKHSYQEVDWKIFKNSFKEYLENHSISFKNTLLAIFYSYACSINKNLSQIKVLIGDCYYHEDHVNDYLKHFPKANFIRIIRDHRSNIQSLSKHLLFYRKTMHPLFTNYRSLPYHILKEIMLGSTIMWTRHEKYLGDKLKIIKYENLLNQTKKTMLNFSEWLEIKFDDNLLRTTRYGKTYFTFSKTQNKEITGTNDTANDKWISNLNRFHILAIEYLFSKNLKKYDYELIFEESKINKLKGLICCALPWKGEFIPSFEIFKNEEKYNGIKNNLIYKYLKFIFFILCNMYGYLESRSKLYLSIIKGEFNQDVI